MKRVGLITLLLVFVMLLSTMGALAQDSSKVIVLVPTGIVDDGTNVDIEVHTFDKAVATEPTDVHAYANMFDEISLSNKGTGIWAGKVEATGTTMISATAQIGDLQDTGGTLLFVNPTIEPDNLEVVMEPKDPDALSAPAPGDALSFTIYVYKNGVLKDDNTLEVYVDYKDQKLAINKVATGTYETTYTIPAITESQSFSLEAQIDDNGMSRSFDSASFYVNFYQVWYHKKSISTTESTFDIYVADDLGKAVEGATVSLGYTYDEIDTWTPISKDGGQATTDKDGKASYTITYSNINGEVNLDGTVTKDGLIQNYGGSLMIFAPTSGNNPPEEPNGYGLEVINQDPDQEFLKPGTKTTMQFKVWYTEGWVGDPAPWANKDVYYYVYSYTKVVDTGKVTTDANGMMTLTLTPPSSSSNFDMLTIDCESETSPGEYDSDSNTYVLSDSSPDDYLQNPEKLKDNDLKITVDELKVGGTSKVTATFSKGSKGTTASFGWYPGKYTIKDMIEAGDTQPEWEQLTSEGTRDMSARGSTYKGTMVIPEFMPKSIYTIYVVAMEPYDLDMGFVNYYDFFHVNYIHVQAGQGGSSGNGGGTRTESGLFGLGQAGGIDVGLILILIIVIAVVLILVMVALRRRSPPPLTQQGTHMPPDQQMQTSLAQAPPPPTSPPPGPQVPPPVAPVQGPYDPPVAPPIYPQNSNAPVQPVRDPYSQPPTPPSDRIL